LKAINFCHCERTLLIVLNGFELLHFHIEVSLSLGRSQRIAETDSAQFDERRVAVENSSVMSNEVLCVWIPNLIFFLNWDQPTQSFGFESNSHLTQIASNAFSYSSLQSILIPRNVEIRGSKIFFTL
jgi:hypothetical protein